MKQAQIYLFILLVLTACSQQIYSVHKGASLARIGFTSNSEYHRIKIESCSDQNCEDSSIIGFVEGNNSRFDLDKKVDKLFVRDIEADKLLHIRMTTSMVVIDLENLVFSGGGPTIIGSSSWGGTTIVRHEPKVVDGVTGLTCSTIKSVKFKADHYYLIMHKSSQDEQKCSFSFSEIVD